MDRDETTTQILNGMQDVLADQWDSMSADVKEAIRTTASFAAKLAVKEAAGDLDYVKKNASHVESMLADVEAIAAMKVSEAFWQTIHKLADIAGTVLVGVAKKSLGLP